MDFQARETASSLVLQGMSVWTTKWRKIITWLDNAKPNQMQITFDTQVKKPLLPMTKYSMNVLKKL